MLDERIRHPKRKSRLQAAVFVLAGLLALLTLGLGTSFAEPSEEEGGASDPVIVPETETPPVTNPAPTPAEPSTPVTSTPAPSVKPTESSPTGSSGSRPSSPSTGSRGGSGGSTSAPTQVNHGLTGSDGGSGGHGGAGSTGGGGGSSASAPTGSSAPSTATTTERSTSGVEKAATALAERAGQNTGQDKKSRQDAVKNLGEAIGKQLLGDGVSVTKPKHHNDGVADFVPLPGKSKTLYFLLVLLILAIASFVVWTQFRGPRESRRRKAHIDHRVTSAARLTPAERLRARQWSTERSRSRPARRKAA